MSKGFSFFVKLLEPLESFEHVAVVGDHELLGAWRQENAVILKRTNDHRIWTGVVALPENTRICYRYFIAAVDKETQTVQVRRWETHHTGRKLVTSSCGCHPKDTFGFIVPGQCSVKRGWLNLGRIVQFKALPKALEINECSVDRDQLRLKLQPVERNLQTPILSSARACTECVRLAFGDSHLHAQPEFGEPYNEDDMVIFHTTLTQLEEVAYLVKLFAQNPDNDLVDFIGYQYIYPEALLGSEGSFSINLISPVWLNTICCLQLQYLVIAPMTTDLTMTMRKTFVDYWPSNWTGLEVGHRGLGKSFKVHEEQPPCIENTVESMKAVAANNGDMVEFDVNLTSDLIPIIYHDFEVKVSASGKIPATIEDLSPLLLKNITYEQLKDVTIYHQRMGQIEGYNTYNEEPDEDRRLFPSLEDFFTKLEKTLAFDIELKWPQMLSDGTMESFQDIDKNTYADRVLEVVLRHASGRFCVLTCFDADMCTMLRYKQNIFPVLYLVDFDLHYYADPRGHSVENATNHAQSFELAGIVSNSFHILQNPELVDSVLGQKKKIFLWGKELCNTATNDWFKRLGSTGVIYDRMDVWVPPKKQSVFEADKIVQNGFDMNDEEGDDEKTQGD